MSNLNDGLNEAEHKGGIKSRVNAFVSSYLTGTLVLILCCLEGYALSPYQNAAGAVLPIPGIAI